RAPELVRPRVWLARVGSADEARHHLLHAQKIAPDDALVASELGRLELAAGRPAEALVHFGRALALSPNHAQAIANRGVAFLLLGQRDAARADFEQALRLDPCSAEARHNLREIGIKVESAPDNCAPVQK
ncbi:MAG TPA: tetratricopeptide repeat protein, partial [Bryobacteraceae bacterium]|nr:tetratricopeptide repeat protein [Bryobacteraceae bacterium]